MSSKGTAATKKPAGAGTKNEEQYDVTQVAYETTKKVWSWGKGVAVVNIFLNTTEAVASKVVSVVSGKKLEEVDGNIIKPRLSHLDNTLLNPAIGRLLHIVGPMCDKVDKDVRPIILDLLQKLLYPLKLLKGQMKEKKSTVVVEEKQ